MSAQSKPIAVLISDIHFTVPTLSLASSSLRSALEKAKQLDVPLIIAGDTLDSKAIMRGECVNALLSIFQEHSDVEVYMLVGNHDLLNEKDKQHTLNFLSPYVTVVAEPFWVQTGKLNHLLIPYMHDIEELKSLLSELNPGTQIIMHQGVQTAFMGHYQQDKTSLPKEVFADFRVISGHYHRAQDIKCGRPRKGAVGMFSYIGNPYTLSFGEAEDGPKGYKILHENGLLTQAPLDLRKHVIIEMNEDDEWIKAHLEKDDLIWVKVRGPQLELNKIKKKDIADRIVGHSNFKLDKIPTDQQKLEIKTDRLTGEQIFDSLIDNTDEKVEEKKALKQLWREVLS